MNGNRIFLDTNILIYFLQGDQNVIEIISDKNIVVSFITELEFLLFPELDKDSIEIIKGLLDSCLIIDINNDIKDQK
jgi:predicted nucleic acid-binding protein